MTRREKEEKVVFTGFKKKEEKNSDSKVDVSYGKKNESEREQKSYVDYKKEIADALIKKAVGYSYSEIVEEFSVSEEEGEKLVKKKITTKSNPPDIPAAKVLLDLFERENNLDLKQLTDEQLKEEIDKITEFLKEQSDEDGS